jgi:two-component system response regulator RegX3
MMAVTEATADAPRVLLVEDEEPILEGLEELFSQQGFVPSSAKDGPSALSKLKSDSFDLVILDLMLPGEDGISILQKTRAAGNETPVLILTAKGAEEDVVAGLEAGADDYVTKPFGIRELVARARGLLRRPRTVPEAPRRLVLGEIVIDFDALSVKHGAVDVRLTAREASLLEYLAGRKSRPVTREELLVDVWGYNDGSVRTRTVDVHVMQLRAKLKKVPGGEALVTTVRGRGYRFGEA